MPVLLRIALVVVALLVVGSVVLLLTVDLTPDRHRIEQTIPNDRLLKP